MRSSDWALNAVILQHTWMKPFSSFSCDLLIKLCIQVRSVAKWTIIILRVGTYNLIYKLRSILFSFNEVLEQKNSFFVVIKACCSKSIEPLAIKIYCCQMPM